MLFLGLSFLAGVLSVAAACVLPLLPVIVGGSLATGGSRRRMYTIIASLTLSIVAFTLVLKATTALIGIPEELWRYLSGGIIFALGVLILFPTLWVSLPIVGALNRSSNKLLSTGYQRGGLWGDVLMGAALGPVFASCSPTYFLILATVLPATPLLGIVYLFAYALGLALTLLLIAILGERVVQALGVSLDPSGTFFKAIGVILIIVGVLVGTGLMKRVEAWIVEKGFDATFIELKLLGAEKNESTPVSKDNAFMSASMKEGMYAKAPELVSPHGYINTGGKPITLAALKGKVVLIDIWTYSCINCQRTLPYLRAWHEAYEDDGLVILGVHTPEFAFEKNIDNVQKAVEEFGLTYPIVLDNEYETWNAYGNRYWPRKYLIDIDGYIVYDHIGEGAYDETEAAIRRALNEKALREGGALSDMEGATPEGVVEVLQGGVQSPEVYFGAWRNELLGNGQVGRIGAQTLTIPEKKSINTLYLGDTWDIEQEYAKNQDEGSIVFRYSAKNVYMVASAEAPVDADIYLDGVFLKTLTIDEHRLYDLVQGETYGEHVLEIRIQKGGVEAYTFTFG